MHKRRSLDTILRSLRLLSSQILVNYVHRLYMKKIQYSRKPFVETGTLTLTHIHTLFLIHMYPRVDQLKLSHL